MKKYLIILGALATVSIPTAVHAQDWWTYGPSFSWSKPIVVDPKTGPYEATFEWNLDGNRFFVDRLVGRVLAQVYAPWPTQPMFSYPSQQYVNQPHPYPDQYSRRGWGWPTLWNW